MTRPRVDTTPPTHDQLRALTPREAHDQHCRDTWIVVDNGAGDGYTSLLRCPFCERTSSGAGLRLALQASGIGERYLDATWADLQLVEPLPALQAAAARITEIITAGHSALLAGPPGTGKTQAATLLLKAAIAAGHTARIANIGHTAMNVRAGYDHPEAGDTEANAVHRMSTTDLLVIDDIGAGEAGDGKLELRILYFVLEARQNAKRATILTSNLTPKGVTDFLGPRITNRLMPLETFVFAHGKNFRAPTGATAWRPTETQPS